MWIKICGNTNLEDALAAAAAGADALGFVFAPSPRRISPKDAASIIAALPPEAEKIGVFVNQAAEIIAETARRAGLTGVQLHGDEAQADVDALKQALPGIAIFKAVAMDAMARHPCDAPSGVRALLLDSGGANKRGGTGMRFAWDEAAPMVRFLQRRTPIIVAGGLTPANVEEAVARFAPWGVDVVSGVEREPGKKDHDSVRNFVAAAGRAAGRKNARCGPEMGPAQEARG